MKTAVIVRTLIVFCLLICIVVQATMIKKMNKKLEQVVILDVDNDSLVTYSPEFLESKTVVLTPRYVDRFSTCQSPFRDGKEFNTLLKEYVHSNWADLYGARRGSKACRRIHEGIDLFVPENTPVYPIAAYGIVTEVSDNPNFMIEVGCTREDGTAGTTLVEYGKIVRVAYPEGIESVYAHLNDVLWSWGRKYLPIPSWGLPASQAIWYAVASHRICIWNCGMQTMYPLTLAIACAITKQISAIFLRF